MVDKRSLTKNYAKSFRIQLHMANMVRGTGNDAWFKVDLPELLDLNTVQYQIAAESFLWNDPNGNAYMVTLTMPCGDNYSSLDSGPTTNNLLLTSRSSNNWFRSVSRNTVGTALTNSAFLRSGLINIKICNLDGTPFTNGFFNWWFLVLVVYPRPFHDDPDS